MAMDAVTKEFFEFCEYSEEDQAYLLPYWEMARETCDLTDEVVLNAMHEHLPRLKAPLTKGTRMIIGALVREFLDIFRLKKRLENGEDVRRLYGVLPANMTAYMTFKTAAGDGVYVGFPDMVMLKTLQEVFHHAEPMWQLAEENGMSYGARHCALNKMGIAGRLTGIIPEPTVMWSWGLVCDEATKVDEFLKAKQNGSWTSVYTRLPHDTYQDQTDYAIPERVDYLADNMRRAMEETARGLGIEYTKEDMQETIESFNDYWKAIGLLGYTNVSADPMPIRNVMINLAGLPAGIPFNTGTKYFIEAMNQLTEDAKRLIAEGKGVVPKGSPRIGMYFNPAPNSWFETILNKNGVSVSFSLPSSKTGYQAEPSKYDDPYKVMAEEWLKGNFGMGCGADIRNWIEKVHHYKADAMIVGFLDYDRWLGQVQKTGARVVEEETGVPTFYVEADFYDDRDYSEEALRTRIESICQIIKMRSAQKRADEAAAQADASDLDD